MDWQQILTQTGYAVLYTAGGILSVLLIVHVLRNVVWAVRYPFLILNWVMWVLYNPLRDYWRHPRLGTANLVFNLLFYSGIAPLWWLTMHIILTPIRIINAVYFDIILYWSVVFCDSISELLHPRLGVYKTRNTSRYLWNWILRFPVRFFHLFSRNGLALLEGILMVGLDTVFPTYTMYHGTSFKGIATNIAQAGRWYVGGGDYAGCGIYFGFYRKTAEHYAKGDDHAMIVARVTIFPCRNSATLPHRLRKKIGNDGSGISSHLPFPWKSIEHWRDHDYAQWFEYCLVQPEQTGQYVRTWRARPICILKHYFPQRIWGGLSLWTGGAGGTGAIVFAWVVIAICILSYYYGIPRLISLVGEIIK
jgi:hypothetical protein